MEFSEDSSGALTTR